jgi:integrase/recombinase XerD
MSGARTMLALAESYLAERRQLGFELERPGSLTLSFARYVDDSGHIGPLNETIVLKWAREKAQRADPFTWAKRVAVLRPFARYLREMEPSTKFPEDSPYGSSFRRLAPHIYTQAEVDALSAAARQLPGGLASATFEVLFGLLAATGLRISEALQLLCGDLDCANGILTIRHAKRKRERMVPLHPTATNALLAYLRVRAKHGATDAAAPLFLSEKAGDALTYPCVRRVFVRLSTKLGIVSRGGHRVVRIHDLRHTFICRRLMLWQKDGTNVGNAMMALSTYVGHVRLSDTYWYIEAVPELMMIASDRFDAFAAGRPEVCHG